MQSESSLSGYFLVIYNFENILLSLAGSAGRERERRVLLKQALAYSSHCKNSKLPYNIHSLSSYFFFLTQGIIDKASGNYFVYFKDIFVKTFDTEFTHFVRKCSNERSEGLRLIDINVPCYTLTPEHMLQNLPKYFIIFFLFDQLYTMYHQVSDTNNYNTTFLCTTKK